MDGIIAAEITLALWLSQIRREQMATDLAGIFSQLRDLTRSDKLFLVQFLISELTQEESAALLKSGTAYPVWSPYDAHNAAAIMLKALADDKANDHA